MNKSAQAWTTNNDDGVLVAEADSAFAFRAAYTAEAFAVDADFHVQKKKKVAALFFSPLSVENLIATAGFTFAINDNKLGDDADKAWAVDLRGRYAINDDAAIGLYLNYTNVDAGDNVDAYGVLDSVLNFNYKINDLLKIFVEGELVFQANSDVKDKTGHQAVAQFGGIFTAGKGAEIDVAARATIAGIGSDQDKDLIGTQIAIPVCMRIKM